MRIAIVTSFPRDPCAPVGGVEAVSVNLVAALAKQPGCEVHVVTFEGEVEQIQSHPWQGATIHRLPRGGGSLLRFATGEGRDRVQDFLRTLKPDLIHSHDTYGMMVKGFPAPRVFTVHGFIHEDTLFGRGKFKRLRSQMWKAAEVAGWADQPHIISISPYVRERLSGLVPGMIHDIENPIDPECFQLSRQESAGTIFSAGAICERKNTLGLLKAFAQVARKAPKASVRWAGPVAEQDYGAAVNQFIASAGLAEKVKLLGSLPARGVRDELAQASIFALLSFEEGAPMGIAEAMAAGIPILTSNRCGMPYMVRHGETGFLVDPNNINDVAAHLRELLENDALRSEMGRRAREVALNLFHPDRVAERTLRVYHRALADAGESVAETDSAPLTSAVRSVASAPL